MRSFAKPAISILEQVDLLKSRGLYIRDEARAADFLSAVSFFRLTPYMRPFQVVSYADHAFLPGTRFRQISQLYEFDRRLRLLLMDAIERTEVAIRSAISNYMGPAYGPHWYLNRSHFKDRYDHERLISTIENAQQKALQDYRREVARIDRLTNADALRKEALKNRRAHESYARHYALTYDSPELMPGWAMLEELTIGDLSHLYRGLAKDNDRKFIGQQLAAPSPLLDSWLHTLTVVRNICAHHARIWNRELAIKPVRPKQAGFSWPDYLRGENQHTRVAMVLAILQHFMRQVSPHTQWCKCLADLFNEYIEIDLQAMGIQDTWYSDPFWQNDLMTANEI
ncbi:abortive infection bacteriophage resistance protein [Paraperlucidibaca baekdonensis]|uniref:Abortive infection bacteriophage resistance protein n=1 Tax=Paraperlucidibaca baekdonensis TaxID=748120 RepID=A0A3E0H8K1_9GAMM|nr:abortive infection bacteriophage resistance protein [Paraperlucidibaca baekdonensis]